MIGDGEMGGGGCQICTNMVCALSPALNYVLLIPATSLSHTLSSFSFTEVYISILSSSLCSLAYTASLTVSLTCSLTGSY